MQRACLNRTWPVTILLLLLATGMVRAENAPVILGLDGEFSLLNSTSAQAIEQGVRVAIEEINASGGVLDGRPMQLLTKDNRSVPARGLENLRQFAEVPNLVAMMGGRYSPVILDQIPLLHQLKLPLLAAWSSADGITDHAHRPSYTFRLSLRDSYAMPVMLHYARSKGAKRVGLLLPNTGWGRSNVKAALNYYEKESQPEIIGPVWYNWGESDMLRHYRLLLNRGMDALVLVANDIEGAVLIRQLASVERRELVPIISHWGVTGGQMVQKSGPFLHQLDFSVVQTFSLFNAPVKIRDRVMKLADQLFGIKRMEDVSSPVGFGQAYDLTHILARAIEIAGSTDRGAIRDALEQVKDYHGLTGNYAQPFTTERHDALAMDQVFIARYREDGVIVPLSSATRKR